MKAAEKINKKRVMRIAKFMLTSLTINELNPLKAITMITIGLIILACTAACPKIKAPTIPMVGPMGEGTRKPASRISSKAISIDSTSITDGNGTLSLDPAMAINKSGGIMPTWKFVIAI